jgi:hypothetical protein
LIDTALRQIVPQEKHCECDFSGAQVAVFKPNNDTISSLVNIAHNSQLGCFLLAVYLIDTESGEPDESPATVSRIGQLVSCPVPKKEWASGHLTRRGHSEKSHLLETTYVT